MSEKTILVNLTSEEFSVFKWVWKNYKLFKKVSQVNGAAKLTLHFNSKGEIKPELTIYGNGIMAP